MKSFKILVVFLFFSISLLAADSGVSDIYPTSWWVGMNNPNLQLIIHQNNIATSQFTISYPGVRLVKVTKVENKNYVFLDLLIAPATKAGTFNIEVRSTGGNSEIRYELKNRNRENGKTRVQGVTSKDLVYLLMPDRFSNGDKSNDHFDDLKDATADRNNPYARHGGDLKGVQNHLDYIKGLGATTVWMTPVLENDMPQMKEGAFSMSGYHGYWITDHYKVDKRFGGNEAYHQLIEAAHANKLKIIQDAVYNHIGSNHWSYLDLPMKDWVNQWPAYQGSNHREEVFFDPYASAIDKKIMVQGWFVPHLPDLNLANPFVASFIIQNAVWSTEEYGIDGWRVDTYKYCDEHFLNAINTALLKEFPAITVFGEDWANTNTGSAYFARNNIAAPFKHNLQGVTDFPLCFAMQAGMTQPFGWTDGVSKLYMTLVQDVLYQDPQRNCIFLENHDMDRIYSVAGENWAKLKMGLTWLLTLRGIPQLYYGTEILMKNFKNPTDAEVRRDFPGGWSGDEKNKFASAGRTDGENRAVDFISRLANFRRNSSALTEGKTMQYIPQDGVYIYFRYNSQQTVMVVANTGKDAMVIDWNRYAERIAGFRQLKDVVTGTIINFEKFTIQPSESFVLELVK